LRISGHAGLDGVTHAVEGDLAGQFFHELRPLGTGADGAHLALEDVEELGKFVHVGGPEDAPHAGDAAVVFLSPHGAVHLRIRDHRPELVHFIPFPLFPHSLLAVEDGARGVQVDDGGDKR
jgi:hypothetical protein